MFFYIDKAFLARQTTILIDENHFYLVLINFYD